MKAITNRFELWLCILILSAMSSSRLKAQYADLSFNPTSALTGTAVLMAEFPVTPMFGLEFQHSYFFRARRFWTPNYFTEGLRIGALTHLYVNSEAKHTEFSVFAYARYLDVRYEADDNAVTTFDRDSYTFSKMTVGFGGSYKLLVDEQFIFSAGVGLGRNFAKKLVRESGNTGDFLSLGIQTTAEIDVYARITIGYRLRFDSNGKSGT